MFKYAMNENIFSNKSAFQEAVQAVKEKKVTVNEIKNAIDHSIICFYNELVSSYFGGKNVNSENIYRKESLEKLIQEEYPQSKQYFGILKENGLIGVCGRGYTFESPKLNTTSLEENFINVIFYKQISI